MSNKLLPKGTRVSENIPCKWDLNAIRVIHIERNTLLFCNWVLPSTTIPASRCQRTTSERRKEMLGFPRLVEAVRQQSPTPVQIMKKLHASASSDTRRVNAHSWSQSVTDFITVITLPWKEECKRMLGMWELLLLRYFNQSSLSAQQFNYEPSHITSCKQISSNENSSHATTQKILKWMFPTPDTYSKLLVVCTVLLRRRADIQLESVPWGDLVSKDLGNQLVLLHYALPPGTQVKSQAIPATNICRMSAIRLREVM